MTFIKNFLFVVGYCLFLGPPRAYEVQLSHVSKEGELAQQPLWVILGLETLLRALLVVIIFTLGELIIGADWYSFLRLDSSLTILLGAGVVHTVGYLYLYTTRDRKRKRLVGVFYRLLRNSSYALTPGLAVVTIWLLIDGTRATPRMSDDFVSIVYLSVTALVFIAGLIEALSIKRRPLGIGSVT